MSNLITKKRFGLFAGLCLALPLIHLIAVITDGLFDEINRPEYIIVFGNKVHPDGRVSHRLALRLDRTLELHHRFPGAEIIVSGGVGTEGQDEGIAMARRLIQQGVPRMKVHIDSAGVNTYATGLNSRRVIRARNAARERDPRKIPILLVTHYYHVSRARLAFRGFGFQDIGTAYVIGLEKREPWSLLRETIGYYYYLFRWYPD